VQVLGRFFLTYLKTLNTQKGQMNFQMVKPFYFWPKKFPKRQNLADLGFKRSSGNAALADVFQRGNFIIETNEI
jgi:hypothetical protein